MEQVLYVLGAGFSAPLGVPTMANFLDVARRLQRTRPGEFGHFEKVFGEIARIARLKNWINSNQHNLEEVLSILEMEDFIRKDTTISNSTKQFVADVIVNSMPRFELNPEQMKAGNWFEYILGNGSLEPGYVAFVGSLLGLEAVGQQVSAGLLPDEASKRHVDFYPQRAPSARYAVVSFNYDRILEDARAYLESSFGSVPQFLSSIDREDMQWEAGCPLVKLHGSIDGKTLTLPTWSKAQVEGERQGWREAAMLFATATQVRFLGFGFSQSDSHFEYLVKAALASSPSVGLTKVDVVCRDPDDSPVRARYSGLFESVRTFRYASGELSYYLRNLKNEFQSLARSVFKAQFNFLESSHESFMTQPRRRAGQ